MDDRFTKYIKLYFLIFLLFLSIPLFISIIIGFVYGFSRIVSVGPAQSVFEILVISMPVLVFTTAYAIFFSRTRSHPSKPVRIISYIIFTAGIIICIYYLAEDLISYFHSHEQDITDYGSFSTLFLAANIATLFIIAIMQAFTTSKEVDWMEKTKGDDYRDNTISRN